MCIVMIMQYVFAGSSPQKKSLFVLQATKAGWSGNEAIFAVVLSVSCALSRIDLISKGLLQYSQCTLLNCSNHNIITPRYLRLPYHAELIDSFVEIH